MNLLKGLAIALVAVGVGAVLFQRDGLVSAQSEEPSLGVNVKCKILVGTIESCATVKVTREITEVSTTGQIYGESFWSVIPCPGVGPNNVILVSDWTYSTPGYLPPGSVSSLASLSAAVGDGCVYLQTRGISYMRTRQELEDEDGNFIGYGPWSEWAVLAESPGRSGPYKINALYSESVQVENPGSGKTLKLDWSGIQPGGSVKGYRVFRRERPDLP